MSELPPPYSPPLLQTDQSNAVAGQSKDKQSETFFVQLPWSRSQTEIQPMIEQPEDKKSSHQKVKHFVPLPSSRLHAEAQPMISVQPSPATGTISYVQQLRPSQLDARRRYTDLTCLAWLVCLCCCWPIGICTIFYADKAQEQFKQGRIEEGKSYQTCTKILISLSIILGIVGCVVIVVMQQNWG